MKTALRVTFGLLLLAMPLLAQQSDHYKDKPAGHEKNKQSSVSADQANLKKYQGNTNILVLPGLVADRQKQRVEVMVESAKLAADAPCEFTIVAEASDNTYETLLISFARPSAIVQALEFIGRKPGEPVDPAAFRFWSKGECLVLSLLKTNEPPLRLEKMFVDRRTNKTLPEQGFRFTGSLRVPDPNNPPKEVYAADKYQPMSIVALFNSPGSIFEVPYVAEQSDVYQNTTVNPEHPLNEGTLLTLLIEPASGTRPIKDLVLQVHANPAESFENSNGLKRLKNLVCQLKDAATVLNNHSSISSVFEAIAKLDRQNTDYYLTVNFGEDIDLGSAQALAKILAIMDCDRGIRINPPSSGQLFYRAFDPDRDLLDRSTRLYQPWELSLAEKDGVVSGKLLRVDSIWTNSAATLEFHESAVSGSGDLQKEFAAETERTAKAHAAGRPPVIIVFAPASLKYGQLRKFLEPAILAHQTFQVFVDDPMPPIPAGK